MARRIPTIPHYVCTTLEVRRLAAAGLFDGGRRRTLLPLVDPRDAAADNREPVEVVGLAEGRAAASIGGQAIECVGRPGLNGAPFWEFRCPCCSAPARKLFRPVGMEAFRCRACWHLARPSRSPRWRGVPPEAVARALAFHLAATAEAGPSTPPPTEAAS